MEPGKGFYSLSAILNERAVVVNTILAKRVNHIVAKGDNPVWPKGLEIFRDEVTKIKTLHSSVKIRFPGMKILGNFVFSNY